MALWLAARDRRTPWAAKIVAGVTAAYALSPIDLIPDFIPVLGLLDDLLIVPGGVWLALRLIPTPLMTELRTKAVRLAKQPPVPCSCGDDYRGMGRAGELDRVATYTDHLACHELMAAC